MPQPDKLEYPSDIAISQQAKDLIGGLLVKPALRLGSEPTGVEAAASSFLFGTFYFVGHDCFILHIFLANTDN